MSYRSNSPNKGGLSGIGIKNIYSDLTDDELVMINCLSKGPLHIDIISENTGLDIKDVSSNLFILEVKGIVEQFPGKIFSMRK